MSFLKRVNNFFEFDSFITPDFLVTIYLACFLFLNTIGAVTIFNFSKVIIRGLNLFSQEELGNLGTALAVFFTTIFLILLANFILRVHFELIMVFFKMDEKLGKIVENTKK